MTNYENFNNSSKSFRIFCDKLSSTNITKNLILESSYNNIQLKVKNDKRIIFNDPVVFNNLMDLNNKSLRRVTTISAENLILNKFKITQPLLTALNRKS
jgi:HKD family nuclease